jgi:DNA polymerase III alpha subunit
MISLFKTHFSIGKSILTLEENSKRSAISLALESGLKEFVLVEDSLIGFLEARKAAKNSGLDLRFGLRILMDNNLLSGPIENKRDICSHKVIIFSKSSHGCKLLNKIYSNAFSECNGVLNEGFLRKIWEEEHLKLAIPFYDSFIYNNTISFANCTPNIDFTKPSFFIEDNGLPVDFLIKSEVELYCQKNSLESIKAKSIYYPNYSDFLAYQTYKCICNRGFKARTLDCPNFDHQGSDQFCFEDWKKKANQ